MINLTDRAILNFNFLLFVSNYSQSIRRLCSSYIPSLNDFMGIPLHVGWLIWDFISFFLKKSLPRSDFLKWLAGSKCHRCGNVFIDAFCTTCSSSFCFLSMAWKLTEPCLLLQAKSVSIYPLHCQCQVFWIDVLLPMLLATIGLHGRFYWCFWYWGC